MGLRQLRSLMLQAGIGVEGCLEKEDLLERVRSSRLVTITHAEPPRPPPPPPPEASSGHLGGGGGGGGGGGRGGGAGEREEEISSASARHTSRTAGWWWGGGRRDGSESASQAEAAPPPPPPPQAASASSTPAVRPLESMSVKELREITRRLGVSTAGCLEKRDMVERIRGCGRYREAAGIGRA